MTGTMGEYQQLLIDFRSAWCKYKDVPLYLTIVCPSCFSTNAPPYDEDQFTSIAQVALPLTPVVKDTTTDRTSTLFGWVLVEKPEADTEATRAFVELCDRAGAALPTEFRDSLASYCPWQMAEPNTWWFILLLVANNKFPFTPTGTYTGEITLTQPWRRCIDTIQRFGLDTSNPSLFVDESVDARSCVAESQPSEANATRGRANSEPQKKNYPTPDNFERDKWIYEQRKAGESVPKIIKTLEEVSSTKTWNCLYSDNGIRDAARRYCKYSNLELPKGKRGRPSSRRE